MAYEKYKFWKIKDIRKFMSDWLSIVGLAVIDVTAFLFQPLIGGLVIGLSLILLSYFLGKE